MDDDLISRQAASEKIRTYITKPNISDDESEIKGYNDGLELAISVLSVLPSAQPERKPGKWEIYVISMFDGEGCRCSECGFEGAPYWDFCPGCGADMRGEQDDQRKSD